MASTGSDIVPWLDFAMLMHIAKKHAVAILIAGSVLEQWYG